MDAATWWTLTLHVCSSDAEVITQATGQAFDFTRGVSRSGTVGRVACSIYSCHSVAVSPFSSVP